MPENTALIDQAIDILTSDANLEFLARLNQTADRLRDLRRILES